MSEPFRTGIEAQAENLEQAAVAVRGRLSDVDLDPLREGTIVFSGIGASWHALLPAVRMLRAAGRRAFAVPAPELALAQGLADAYVLVSQSGASTELLALLERLGGAPVYAVSAHAEGPLAQRATVWLPLGPRPDTAVSTLSYTATLQTLGMLCEEILRERGRTDWRAVAEHLDASVQRDDAAAATLAESLAGVGTIDAVGSAAALASAGETGLLVREALRLPACAEETRQYLHGPLEAVDERFGCILFGGDRELELARALVSFGATVCAVSDRASEPPGIPHVFRLPPVSELAAPILQIIPIQLTVAHAARARGLEVQELRRQQHDTKAQPA